MTQDEVVEGLKELFSDPEVDDRREHPSHGYRAVHVIAEVQGKPVEIQVRTRLQDLWAQLCEVISDEIDKDLKYGGARRRSGVTSTPSRSSSTMWRLGN